MAVDSGSGDGRLQEQASLPGPQSIHQTADEGRLHHPDPGSVFSLQPRGKQGRTSPLQKSQTLCPRSGGRVWKRRALPAVCLNTNASVLTAWANDFSYDGVFERQVDALGENKDVFLAITTSGNSQNIIRAMQKAKERGMIVILLTGKGGGLAYKLAHYAVKVPSSNTPRIQEAHALILHTICQIVDDVHGK